ncbi:hypothetical protein Syun_009421 [Stephania yunnanensis]|uniref:Uncharacterized protein n=1 Tax=Stephania yunnanensis TaxID=152371 RepID=A0AAP0KGY6_9MAGN
MRGYIYFSSWRRRFWDSISRAELSSSLFYFLFFFVLCVLGWDANTSSLGKIAREV